MVKALSLLQSALATARNFLSNLTTNICAALAQKPSKNIPPKPIKKRKIIAKKDIRAQIRRKLQTKIIGNASPLSTEESDSSSSTQVRSLSAISGNSPAEIDAKFAEYLASNDEELNCSVCRSLMQLPTVTPCSHVFCLECIENSLVVSNRCPLCRASVATEDSYGLQSLRSVEKLLQARRAKEKGTEEQIKRAEEHDSWKTSRFVEDEQLVAGMPIDVWKCDSREWKKGQVLLREEDALLVTYHNHSQGQNEIIQLPSLRVAKEGFYSSRYQADEFSFPDLQFRSSIRLGSQDLSILPFRRQLHLRLANATALIRRDPAPLPPLPRRIGLSPWFNSTHIPYPPISQSEPQPEPEPEVAREIEPEDLGRLEALSPEEIRMPELPREDMSELLPNLNPEAELNEFRRQAENSSSSSEEQEEDVFPFIEHLNSDF